MNWDRFAEPNAWDDRETRLEHRIEKQMCEADDYQGADGLRDDLHVSSKHRDPDPSPTMTLDDARCILKADEKLRGAMSQAIDSLKLPRIDPDIPADLDLLLADVSHRQEASDYEADEPNEDWNGGTK